MQESTIDSPTSTEGRSFVDLGIPAVMVHALRRSGIDAPFPIQSATIPDVLAGRDVLGRDLLVLFQPFEDGILLLGDVELVQPADDFDNRLARS